MSYIKWSEFIPRFNCVSNLKLYLWDNKLHDGLHGSKGLPVSISECEFNFVRDYIIDHNLKSAFDLSTGVGIGTTALGLGMKETGGTVVSFDSYNEEMTGTIPIGLAGTPAYQGAEGYRIAQQLIGMYELNNVVKLNIGWSPIDTTNYFKKYYSKFDCVLLDCPKTLDDLRRDASSLDGRLHDKFAIFIHDTHCFDRDTFNNYINNTFGINPQFLHEYYVGTPYHTVKHYPLALVTNI